MNNKQVIYFDNNATTKVADKIVELIVPLYSTFYGNPSSMHNFGGDLSSKIAQARSQVASLIHCDPSEIIFTSGGTESDNAAIKGVLASSKGRRKIITSRVEHPAVLTVCRALQGKGYKVVEIGVDRTGALDMAHLESEIDDDTALVTLMYANNETGVIFPVDKIAELTSDKDVIFHTDAVQAVGKLPVNLQESKIDLLSLSAHKLHGLKGTGVLYVRKGTRLSPFMLGGHQESGKRAGTENVGGIVALGKACQLAEQNMQKDNGRMSQLRDKLEERILKTCKGATVNGDSKNRLPNTTNISFEYIEGEAILMMLDMFGVCASSGSACSSGSLEPSHVLRAMGVPFTQAHGSIRFSLSRYNTEKEIDFVVEKMPSIVDKLRDMSPFVN